MTQPLLQVTGMERSAADVRLPSLVYGWPVVCSLSHGEVLAIDCEAVRGQRGVLAVLTAGHPLAASAARFSELLRSLLSPTVEHGGRVVALVLAESRQQARDAAAKISLRVRAQDAVVTISGALSSGSTKPSVRLSAGQAAEYLTLASNRFKQTYRTEPRLLGSMASGVATAVWRGDALTVYAMGQPKPELASALGVPSDKLLTVTSSVGAAFGSAGLQSVLAAIASAQLDRPVRVELPPLATDGIIAETVQTIQLGLDSQDRAQSLLLHGAVGSSVEGSADAMAAVMDLAAAYGFGHRELSMVPLPLHLPTGTRSTGPKSWCELTFSVEVAIDEVAVQLGRDPLALRLRWIGEDATGDGAVLRGCLQLLHKLSGLGQGSEVRPSVDRAATVHVRATHRGVGVACAVHRSASGTTFFGAHFVEVELVEGRIELRRHVCVLAAGQPSVQQESESVVHRSLEQARRLALQGELRCNPRTGWTAQTRDDGGRASALQQCEVAFLSLPHRETVIASEDDLAGLATSGVAASVACAVSAALGTRVRCVPPVSRVSAGGPT